MLAGIELPANATGPPITYIAGGKQYIVFPMADFMARFCSCSFFFSKQVNRLRFGRFAAVSSRRSNSNGQKGP
jgi:hypothetical protein